MAVRPLNSIAGFSTGDPAIAVIQANGDITTINLTANGVSNLGPVSNLILTGGSNGQALITDGNGNLTFGTVNTESNRAAPMPYLIPTGESYIVNENFQGLYSQPITIDGELTVDGILIEVGFSVNADDNQVYYDINGVPTGTEGFTFNPSSLVLSTPGNISANGSILPFADDTFDLGTPNLRWRDGYFSGNTIFIGDSTISVDENGYIVITNNLGGSFTVEGTAPVDTTEIDTFSLYVNDIVFARTGNTTGKTYLYNKKDGELIFAGFLIRFTPNQDILDSRYLKLYTETNDYWKWVKVMSTRTGQPGINSNEYGKLSIKFPPLEEQKQIAEILSTVDNKLENLKEKKRYFEELKKGLMQKLLTGEVRV
jgi:hypothetical protein